MQTSRKLPNPTVVRNISVGTNKVYLLMDFYPL